MSVIVSFISSFQLPSIISTSSSPSERASLSVFCGDLYRHPHFSTLLPSSTHTQMHKRTRTPTTHSLFIPVCLLCFTCAILSRALSLPIARSLLLSLPPPFLQCLSYALSLTHSLSLLCRAAESASSLCPNTDRLRNVNLRRKRIRERVCLNVCVRARERFGSSFRIATPLEPWSGQCREKGILFQSLSFFKSQKKSPIALLCGMDSEWLAEGRVMTPFFRWVIVASSGLVSDRAARCRVWLVQLWEETRESLRRRLFTRSPAAKGGSPPHRALLRGSRLRVPEEEAAWGLLHHEQTLFSRFSVPSV